ncbi:MAG: hypothetical protein QOG15_648 [Solirubrobacteraceae bacterium]|jgi:hypothetical protein|nr:hypothetical protein [Solirubrobacteraceae bacterium]
MSARGRLTIAGSIAQKPHQAGHSWQFLQYLLGFRRLGWDVLFVDRLEDALCRDAAGRPCTPQASVNLSYLDALMREFALDGAWSVVLDGRRHAGLDRASVLEHIRESELLINVMGFLGDEELLGAARRRVFLDTDPGFGQMWRDLGLADIFAGHDAHVTIGERIGRADCAIPTCGLDWITTPQPVLLDGWPVAPPPPGSAFTTVGRWRGAYGPVEHGGHTYGLRVHEFRRFAGLPRACGGDFELALDIDPAETTDLALLAGGGWALVDPARAGATPARYRAYIAASAAEFMVAKGMYVDSASGWFSERSICYLASGRPVLAQDTGLADLYPLGEGLIAFSTLDEAVAGVEAIRADPERHARAARAIAVEHFDSDKVLGRLLERLA